MNAKELFHNAKYPSMLLIKTILHAIILHILLKILACLLNIMPTFLPTEIIYYVYLFN